MIAAWAGTLLTSNDDRITEIRKRGKRKRNRSYRFRLSRRALLLLHAPESATSQYHYMPLVEHCKWCSRRWAQAAMTTTWPIYDGPLMPPLPPSARSPIQRSPRPAAPWMTDGRTAWSLSDRCGLCEPTPETKKPIAMDGLFANYLVAWGGIEPPTQGFSILCSTD